MEVPFRDVPGRHLQWQLPEWGYFDVVRVELECGAVGYGETMQFYTWGETTDAEIERALGDNAASLMWDDSHGAGLQIALFDAVGRALDVPVHCLLGAQSHDRTPVAWWCFDYPTEDWADEATTALERGYPAIKLKGRPWFDLRAQVEALSRELPEWFSIDIDFNWADGPTMYFVDHTQLWRHALDDALPYFERDVTTRRVPDDGSDRWERLRERARSSPVVEDG